MATMLIIKKVIYILFTCCCRILGLLFRLIEDEEDKHRPLPFVSKLSVVETTESGGLFVVVIESLQYDVEDGVSFLIGGPFCKRL